MLRKLFALLLTLCLLCPAAMAESDGASDDLTEFFELYQMYQTALDNGMDFTFEEFCDYYLTYMSKAGSSQEVLPAATEEPEPAVIELTASSVCLPDPHYFFNEKLAHREDDITGGHRIFFTFNRAHANAASEYITLLTSRFHFSLRTVYTDYAETIEVLYYIFDYAGNADIDDIAVETTVNDVVFTAPLIIETVEFSDQAKDYRNVFSLYIYYGPDITFVETNDRCSVTGFIDTLSSNAANRVLGPVGSVPSSTPTQSGSDAQVTVMPIITTAPTVMPIITTAPSRCSFCNGTGRRTCLTCNGLGTVHSNGTKKTCPNSFCVGGKVSCTMCGGTGWR